MKRNGLKLFRIKQNLFQSEMAAKLNISTSNYCLIELGKRNGGFKFWNALQKTFVLSDKQIERLQNGEYE